MAHLNRILLPLTLLVFLTGFSQGRRERRKINALGIPPLAADATVPRDARPDQYFFLDEAAADLVLDYPVDLTEENFGLASGKRVRERVKLAFGVRPTVELGVAANAGFVYEYRLGNETSATAKIGKWVLELEFPGDDIRSEGSPRGWGFETWELPDERVENRLEVMNLIPGARPVTAGDLVRKRASWWYRGLGGQPLQPGTCCLSFKVHCRRLPGIVTAYFQGTPYHVAISSSVPHVLRSRVPAFNFIETNSVSIPVIGPKFEPTMEVEARVCDIIGDVARLVRERRLEDTPFTRALLTLSNGCLQNNPAKLAAALASLPDPSGDPFESEILDALQMNLDPQ